VEEMLVCLSVAQWWDEAVSLVITGIAIFNVAMVITVVLSGVMRVRILFVIGVINSAV